MTLAVRAHDLKVIGKENIVKALDELSLSMIQLVAYKSFDKVKYEKGSLTKDEALGIGEYLKANKKAVPLVGAYFNPVHPNREKAMHGRDMFCEYIDLAQSLGADTVGSESGSYMGDPWGYHPDNASDEAFERVVDTFSYLCTYAEKRGVYVGMEGAYNHVLSTPKRLKSAIDKIGKDNIRVIFDLYNYLDISNVESAYDILDTGIEIFGDKIHLFHIKDFVIENGTLKQCGVGRGCLDFDKILRKIYTHNKNATLVLEGTVGEDLPYAVSFLKAKMANIVNNS